MDRRAALITVGFILVVVVASGVVSTFAQQNPQPQPVGEVKLEITGTWAKIIQPGYREISLRLAQVNSLVVYDDYQRIRNPQPAVMIGFGANTYRLDFDTLPEAKEFKNKLFKELK